jgi:uncharacterized membrane protein
VVYVPYAVGIGFGLGYGVGEYAERVRHVFRALITWNTGASMYLALAWSTIVLADAETTRMRARMQDSSRYVIFVLVVTAAAASVVAIGFLLGNAKELAFWPRTIRFTLCAFALGSSSVDPNSLCISLRTTLLYESAGSSLRAARAPFSGWI